MNELSHFWQLVVFGLNGPVLVFLSVTLSVAIFFLGVLTDTRPTGTTKLNRMKYVSFTDFTIRQRTRTMTTNSPWPHCHGTLRARSSRLRWVHQTMKRGVHIRPMFSSGTSIAATWTQNNHRACWIVIPVFLILLSILYNLPSLLVGLLQVSGGC